MFYSMIQRKRDEWYASDDCMIKSLIEYIIGNGHMRDAQIDAIKTYLFLKIGCDNKPLSELFKAGKFNSIDIDEIELSGKARTFIMKNPAAAALLEYAALYNDIGEQVAPKVVEAIKKDPASINYDQVFNDIFYNVSYTDYLFSLPMGAGKTYLMAAFIYLDLYFAINEPDNPVFAHNFIIFAPSGTKTAVVPSLKNIQRFDPKWVIPEPSATNIKKQLIFEILDQAKTGNKQNKTKNPNVQKIANHQPFEKLFGLVAVTNAEKVILDRIEEKNGQISWFEESEDELDKQANELRYLIGKIPNLSIYIDEVHHASSNSEKANERKLRSVVNRWADKGFVNSVLGFTGTPYIGKAEKVAIKDKFKISSKEIANVVYYYPLVKGVGNFLKHPVVKIADMNKSADIVEKGVREFLDTYKDTVYEGGLTAKLAIYCGRIEKLEEDIYPLVSQIVAEYGLSDDVILKFHGGNKFYKVPSESVLEFASLDKSISRKRIILFAQIGKEGWDCQSLTGVILSQEGDCPKNMVLQTACRCLRQVGNDKPGNALIYLNRNNGDILENQLDAQHTSLKEFEAGADGVYIIRCYDRTDYLKLPPIDFYQLNISYDETVIEKADPSSSIKNAYKGCEKGQQYIREIDFSGFSENDKTYFVGREHDRFSTNIYRWAAEISKEGFGSPPASTLLSYKEFRQLFEKITVSDENSGLIFFDPDYDINKVNANVRKAFCDKREFTTKEEIISDKTKLLNIVNFTKEKKLVRKEKQTIIRGNKWSKISWLMIKVSLR